MTGYFTSPLQLRGINLDEDNITVHVLGMLCHSSELRTAFIKNAFRETPTESEVIFFSRIGVNFLRDLISRADINEVEKSLNSFLDLPSSFQWRRNGNRTLTMPSNLSEDDIGEMIQSHNKCFETQITEDKKDDIVFFQQAMNTEPDLVLLWENSVAVVEIKALSGLGKLQLERQKTLVTFIADSQGWIAHRGLLVRDDQTECVDKNKDLCVLSWGEILNIFSEVENPPDVSELLTRKMKYRNHEYTLAGKVRPEEQALNQAYPVPPDAPKWHFSHLGRDYFVRMKSLCESNDCWPVSTIYLGITGEAYSTTGKPNWMVRTLDGLTMTNRTTPSYNEKNCKPWPADEIITFFDL